jgi:O-antigen/teichoic acid export membrane protein
MTELPLTERPPTEPTARQGKLHVLVSKVSRNWATIFPTLWGPALGMLGLALGTRLVTEVTSAETFGSVKLAHGALGLGVALLARPFAQFTMRAFHDARASGDEHTFLGFVDQVGKRVGALVALLVGLGLIACSALGLPVSWAAAGLMVPVTFIEIALTIESSLAQTRNEQRLVSVLDVARQWVLPLFTVGFVCAFADSPVVFLAAQLVFLLLAWTAFLRATRHHVKTPPAAEQVRTWTSQARSYAGPIVLSGACNWVLALGDRFLLAHYSTPDEVGRYSAVYGLMSTPIVVVGATLARIFYPFVFRSASLGRAGETRSMLIGMALVSGGVGLVAVLVTALFGETILGVALASKYLEGANRWIIWIAGGNAFLIVSYALDLKVYADKATSTFMYAAGLGAAVNLALNFTLIPTRGAEGAAIATFFGYASYLAVIGSILWRRSKSE